MLKGAMQASHLSRSSASKTHRRTRRGKTPIDASKTHTPDSHRQTEKGRQAGRQARRQALAGAQQVDRQTRQAKQDRHNNAACSQNRLLHPGTDGRGVAIGVAAFVAAGSEPVGVTRPVAAGKSREAATCYAQEGGAEHRWGQGTDQPSSPGAVLCAAITVARVRGACGGFARGVCDADGLEPSVWPLFGAGQRRCMWGPVPTHSLHNSQVTSTQQRQVRHSAHSTEEAGRASPAGGLVAQEASSGVLTGVCKYNMLSPGLTLL